jgi:hypothetical protein
MTAYVPSEEEYVAFMRGFQNGVLGEHKMVTYSDTYQKIAYNEGFLQGCASIDSAKSWATKTYRRKKEG